MNGKAREILRQDPAANPIHTVGELVRYLGGGLSWTGVATSQDGNATRIDYRNPEGDLFSMMIEIINQLILITISELGQPDRNAEPDRPDAKTVKRFARLLGLG